MSRRLFRLIETRGSGETCGYRGLHGIRVLTVSLLVLFLTSAVADSRGFEVSGNAGEYQIAATIDRYPLVLGDNHIEIEIRNRSGGYITDAEVFVNYYMPPMPRMVPMNYKTEASLDSEKYEAKMNIIMAGPWYIKIIIKHGGKISTTKFNVDAQ